MPTSKALIRCACNPNKTQRLDFLSNIPLLKGCVLSQVLGSGGNLVRGRESDANNECGAALNGCLAQLVDVLAVLDANGAPSEIGACIDEAINSLRTYLVPNPPQAAGLRGS